MQAFFQFLAVNEESVARVIKPTHLKVDRLGLLEHGAKLIGRLANPGLFDFLLSHAGDQHFESVSGRSNPLGNIGRRTRAVKIVNRKRAVRLLNENPQVPRDDRDNVTTEVVVPIPLRVGS